MVYLIKCYLQQIAALALLLLLLVLAILPVEAQTVSVDEAEFWALLTQTSIALENPSTQQNNLLRLRRTWEQIREVRLTDGDILPLDTTWIVVGLNDQSMEGQAELQSQVRALLDYRASQVQAAGSDNSLSALDRILQDNRFQYPDVTPTPNSSQDDFSLPNLPIPGTAFSQIILFIVGVVVAGGIIAYFVRISRTQPASTRKPDTVEDGDPETSADAHDMAQTSEQERDYRSAVRYLYLSSLLMLDERGFLHYDRSLTNREHLQQIADKPQLVNLLRPVVNTFDRVWYGFAPLNERHYQEFRKHVERLRELTL